MTRRILAFLTFWVLVGSAGAANVNLNMTGGLATTDSVTISSLTANNLIKVDGYIVYKSSSVSIDNNGVGTSSATYTLTPNTSNVEITCNDANGCAITMGETGITDGRWVEIVNISTNTLTFSDSSGVSEMAGEFIASSWDAIIFEFVSDRWVEEARSNN